MMSRATIFAAALFFIAPMASAAETGSSATQAAGQEPTVSQCDETQQEASAAEESDKKSDNLRRIQIRTLIPEQRQAVVRPRVRVR